MKTGSKILIVAGILSAIAIVVGVIMAHGAKKINNSKSGNEEHASKAVADALDEIDKEVEADNAAPAKKEPANKPAPTPEPAPAKNDDATSGATKIFNSIADNFKAGWSSIGL